MRTRHLLRRSAVALAMLGSTLAVSAAGPAAPAWALPGDGTIRIINKLSNLCLTTWGSGDGAVVTQTVCDRNAPAQWWRFSTGTTGTTITNQGTNRCLDLWGNGGNNGQLVFTWSCYSPPSQKWRLVGKGSQYWEIRSRSNDKCLDLAGDNRAQGAVVQQWGCNWGDNANQTWWLG